MTDFTHVNLRVASTKAGGFHSVGFDVRKDYWSHVKASLEELDTGHTIHFREETAPRQAERGSGYMWVWVGMTNQTSVSVLVELGKLSSGQIPEIHLKGDEFP